ncbi:PadR family transcriptional regulator [Sciscionella sediminilitoris]|uniref:PadR family transcriptional regulator n=1 Tax=Sciscionella sediminilitoris TaxID=1445613 RepID=UPI0004DF7C3B|nr:PadR family transcriptional regulator [Sciscionella sp. SE31]
MSLRYALLGLLHDGPASGYDLTQRFAAGIGQYAWSAKHSQIYPELRKLEEAGLTEVVEEGARGRRVYGMTEAGLAELRTWLYSEPRNGAVRNEFLLRMFMLSALEPEQRLELLRDLQKWATEQHSAVSAIFEHLETGERPLPSGAYAAKFGMLTLASIQEWTRWAIAEQEKS